MDTWPAPSSQNTNRPPQRISLVSYNQQTLLRSHQDIITALACFDSPFRGGIVSGIRLWELSKLERTSILSGLEEEHERPTYSCVVGIMKCGRCYSNKPLAPSSDVSHIDVSVSDFQMSLAHANFASGVQIVGPKVTKHPLMYLQLTKSAFDQYIGM